MTEIAFHNIFFAGILASHQGIRKEVSYCQPIRHSPDLDKGAGNQDIREFLQIMKHRKKGKMKRIIGIDSIDPTVKSQIEALYDSGKIVHLLRIKSFERRDLA